MSQCNHSMGASLKVRPVYSFERHHWLHHREFFFNYGSSMLWDILLGTTYEAHETRRQARGLVGGDLARETQARQQRAVFESTR